MCLSVPVARSGNFSNFSAQLRSDFGPDSGLDEILLDSFVNDLNKDQNSTVNVNALFFILINTLQLIYFILFFMV